MAIPAKRFASVVRTVLLPELLGVLILATATCRGDAGGDGDADVDADADADADGPVGTNPFVEGVDGSLGDELADRLVAAARLCGYQGWGTIPPGWAMVPTGELGCAVWAPPDWTSSGAGSPVTVVEQGPGVGAGFISMAGTPDASAAVDCTPEGAATYVTQSFEAHGCAGPETIYWDEYVDEVAGLAIPTADYLFTCTMGGATRLSFLWVTIQGTSPLCSIVVMGFWVPTDQIEALTCTLTQVFQSVRCPQPGGGYCDPASCHADCVASGHAGGTCTADDDCQCT